MDRSRHDVALLRHASTLTTVGLVAMLSLFCVDCGGGSPASPEPGGGNGTAVVFTITANGVTPKSVTVTLGTQVTFTNNDAGAHLMYSDPHPDHTDCPELNQVGALDRGQTRQTGNLNTARTCGFHDHNQPLNAGLRGTIVIH